LSKSRFGNTAFWTLAAGTLLLYFSFLVALVVAAIARTKLSTVQPILFCPEIKFAIGLSLLTATITTVLSMLVAVPAAYALSQYRGRGQSLLEAILDLPLVLPPVALGFLLLVFLQSSVGLAIQEHFLQFVFEVPGIILAQFAVVSGFALRVMESAVDSLDPRYEEVARTLGLTKGQAFMRIVLPLSRNGLIASAALTWARSVGEFGATLIVAGAFERKTEVLSIAIFLNWQLARIHEGLTLTLLLLCVSLLALALFRKFGGVLRV